MMLSKLIFPGIKLKISINNLKNIESTYYKSK
jgi:hypothetical protein